MTDSSGPGLRVVHRGDATASPREGGSPPERVRPLAATGALAGTVAAGVGLATITPLVLAGWIAAPHGGLGLIGVVRTAMDIWLAAHHVGFALHGAGRIGMLPLGLVLLPGVLLWRAGRWVVRTGKVTRLAHVGHAAASVAVPYAILAGLLAMAGRSRLAAASLPQAVFAAFLIAFCAAGLGAARALAPWGKLMYLLPPRPRSIVLGAAGSLTVLAVVGAMLAGASLAAHLNVFLSLNADLRAGAVGAALLLLAQLAYIPNAVAWAVCFTLGPGFAFGAGTVVAPTGVVLGPLPAFPLLAALPTGAEDAVPGWASALVLAAPYLAGAFGGLLLARVAPTAALEAAPLWGFACGAATGAVIAVVAAFAGGPLGSGHLAAVGPSGWQAGVVATLEVGVAAAVAAGAANWLRIRRDPVLAAGPEGGPGAGTAAGRAGDGDDAHHLYLDPWSEGDRADRADPEGDPPVGPAALP